MSESTESIDYAQEWQDDLATLDTIQDGSMAIEYCFTNLLPDLCGYYEQQMAELAGVMTDLSECLNYENEIQAIFNEGQQVSEGELSMDDYEEDVAHAMDLASELEELLEQDEDVIGESTVEDIEMQLDVLFPYGFDSSDPDAVYNNAYNWGCMWATFNAENVDETETTQNDASALQTADDAFNAMTNHLSSMSSQVQSEFQFVESEDQQMQGLISNMEQQWSQTMQVMTNNEITG